MQRPLGYWETFCALSERRTASGQVVQTMTLEGPLDADVARDALTALQHRHPLLQAVVLPEGAGFVFSMDGYRGRDRAANAARVPLQVRARRNDTQWQEVAAQVTNRPLPEDGYAWQAYLLLGTDRHELILVVGHTVADGVSTARLAYDFAAIAAGTAPDLTPLPLLPPVEQLIPRGADGAGGGTVDKAPPSAPLALTYVRHAPQAERETRIIWETLEADLAQAVIAQCRRRNTRLNGLLFALAAAWARDRAGAEGAASLPGGLAFSLRDACRPPVGDDAFGCFVGMLASGGPLPRGADPWEAARAWQARIGSDYAVAERAGFFPTTFDPAHLEKDLMAGFRFREQVHSFGAPLAISNLGALPWPPRVGPRHVVRDLFFWTAQVSGYYFMPITMLGFGGRMHLSFTYTHPLTDEATARGFTTFMTERLAALAAE